FDYVGCILRAHMILMIMGCQHCIHLFDRKWINYKWYGTKIRLHRSCSAHICHLMSDLHLPIAVCSLSVSTPQIHCDVAVSRSFEPHSGTSKPPHCYSSRFYLFCLNLLVEPGTPFRKCTHNPALPCDVVDFAHKSPPFRSKHSYILFRFACFLFLYM